MPDFDKGGEELSEKVVFINRSSKVVKGGRRFKFSALVVVGDRKGRVGLALGKASEVADAIRRGGELARTKMVSVRLKDILSKSLGSKNAANVVKATVKALLSLRLREDIFKSRGIELKKFETPKAPEATAVTA